ncbi:MAG: UTP--glucose-1-phosphate uridylyltransferase, partial [bacterium]|nr:UTP--glucose-1-phosphate uridylyltransferase [bacterium]
IVFVTAIGKRAIEDHFDRNFELEYRLEQKKKKRELAEVAAIGKLASFAFVRQAKPLGDGDAVLAALPFVDEHEPVAILFGDDIVDAKTPGLAQLMEVHATYGGSVIAVTRVPRSETHRYGIIAGRKCAPHVHAVTKFVEKPRPAQAPSTLAFIGRSIITPQVMALLRQQRPGKDGEIRLTDAFIDAIRVGEPLFAREIIGDRYDCGNKLGFLQANVAFALRHPDLNGAFRKFIKHVA